MGLGRRRQRQPPQELAPDVLGSRVPRFRVQPVHQQAEGPRAQEPAVFGGIFGPPPGTPDRIQRFLDLLQVGQQEIVYVRALGRIAQGFRLHGS